MVNEGTLDRVIRVVVGLVLLSLVFFGPHTVFGWIGVVPLLTGLVGYCPMYRVLGVNTCSPSAGRAGKPT
jgi:membrane protein implicated in regulation of membrane protease activity